MPKTSYTPTETDRATGVRVRQLRKLAGETLLQTVNRSGVAFGQATLCRVELGERQLTIPEATKLAAHFNTTVDRIIVTAPQSAAADVKAIIGDAWPIKTEQAWLGNPEPAPLFAVPRNASEELERAFPITLPGTNPNLLMIDLTSPLTPEQYREQVWVPYLEARYNTDQEASRHHAA